MKNSILFFLPVIILTTSCTSGTTGTKNLKDTIISVETKVDSSVSVTAKTPADAAAILSKKEVPILCYHHIRESRPGQSETIKNYSVSPSQFAEQMKALKDSGYQTILPEQLYNYLVYNETLPAKPVMLTFDDTDEEQFSIGKNEMDKYGFKAVYFIMTVSINRPRYMSKEQLKQLADEGNNIESHTWNHQMVTKYKDTLDWETQLVKPTRQLETITGKQVKYFAYPFGLWNQSAIPELKNRGYKMAFQLSAKRDSTEPLYTVRRMLVPGQWTTAGMFKAMNRTFH